jgi:sulfur carrier protein
MPAIKIHVNGDILEHAAPCTISDLLNTLDMSTGRVAVEVNQNIIPRSQHQHTALCDGDIIEIVHAIGGG